ncbi:sulfate adenylyltransferase subunit CysN [Microvirga roseola]|uniref:sulfate adenylyltransferase subunit CysN n=1 Tax=Microvirga roseola TaxID=2883126 RepID=UPI001E4743F1|nr:sulfate adenylyltransferase subunit CysN [Microvirga roseola]
MAGPTRDHSAGGQPDLPRHTRTNLLRFITCGSVDDGKSTLIGRLLYDCKLLFEDQLASLETDSRRFGTTGAGQLDLALLVDGLAAEREQGITIDVAYRFFATGRRRFIVADTPGHEQYTRNMVTGASTAQAAVLLVDARKGLLTQTRRHSHIVSLLGVRHVVLAVNKMDAIGWDRAVFERITAAYRAFARELGLEHVTCIPLSALTGDNVTSASPAMAWYDGPSLLQYLETVEIAFPARSSAFRMPVQWVNRPHQDFRGFAGTVASGCVQVGDPVAVLPGGRTTRIEQIVTMDGVLEVANAGDAVTLVLSDDLDVSRGDVIASADDRPEVCDQFLAHVVWMGEQPLLPGRPYLLRLGTASVGAQVTELKYAVNVSTQERVAAKCLARNEVGVCNLATDQPIALEPYRTNQAMGSFILIDRMSNATVGCGMIEFALRRASNVHRQKMTVNKAARAAASGQKPCVLWFTGLSGAGKSTIADLVEQELHRRGCRTMSLDGDNVRNGLNKDLGFTDVDRVENVRRVAEVARLMVEAGLIVLVSLISPFRSERLMARSLVEEDEFLEIFVDAPLAICEARDPKGLYRKTRAGLIPNFTGIGSPYEPPEHPDLVLASGTEEPERLTSHVIQALASRGIIP